MIPFNKPYLTGKEDEYIIQSVKFGQLSGNGHFTKKCHNYFKQRYNFRKVFLTTSCTDALEMSALLLDIKDGDEIIMPSFTFVSTALAFVRQGAKIVFVDSSAENPNISVNEIEPLINKRTKAIVVVHYAGISVDMVKIMELAENYNLFVVEDAAQAIESQFKGKQLGGIGHLGVFSFHETKNVISGEGGLLVINDERFKKRAEIVWEKGTNRAEFFRGEVDKYGWVDIGSSFLPSEIVAAFLMAQLENLDKIQIKRKQLWDLYYKNLMSLIEKSRLKLPEIPNYATNNAHMFYLVCNSLKERTELIAYLKEKGVHAVFHYQGLHLSKYYFKKHDGRKLPNCEIYSNCLVRLPMFYELQVSEVLLISEMINHFYIKHKTKPRCINIKY